MKKLLFVFLCFVGLGVLQAKATQPEMPLTHAILHNDIRQVEDAIKNGANVSIESEYYSTYIPLCLAMKEYVNKDIIKILLNNGANVNTATEWETPLICAVKEGRLDIVKILIDKGADVNIQSTKGLPPLFAAKTKKMAEYLVKNGADVNAINYRNQNCLDNILSSYGRNKNVELKLFAYLFPQVKNTDINKLLHKAVKHGNIKIVKMLVKNGADVNSLDENKSSVIAKAEDKKIAKYLISKGAKIDDVYTALIAGETNLVKEFLEKENYSPKEMTRILCYAAHYGETDIVKMLIQKGVDVNRKDGVDKAPLHYAAEKGTLEMVKFLVENGADVNIKYGGATPLFFATFNKDKRIMEYLISKGNDVNTKLDNTSALLQSSMSCNKEAIEILMKHKAKMISENVALTPIEAIVFAHPTDCSLSKKERILKMMIKYGADANMTLPYYSHMPFEVNVLDKIFLSADCKDLPYIKILMQSGAKNHKETNKAIIWYTKAQCPTHTNTNIIEFLLENGFDVNIKDDEGKTALDYANTENMKQFLISHGAKSGKELK